MRVINYINELNFREPSDLAIFLLVLTPIIFGVFYILSYFFDSILLLIIGVAILAVLLIQPLSGLIVLFLLWFSPEKYKEKEMKRKRKERELKGREK